MHVGERVQLSEHTHAVYVFRYLVDVEEAYARASMPLGEGSVIETPGWYTMRGFRTVAAAVTSGPHASLKDARIADARYRMAGYMPFDMARRASKPLIIWEPVVIIGEQSLRIGTNVRIDSFTKLECGGGMLIGNNVHIASFCHLGIGGGLTILEDGSSFGSGAKVISGSNVPGLGHGCSAVDPAAIFSRSFCIVSRNATLFAGAIALPGVVIGENAVLAAGAVATKDVPANSIYAGVPARKIGEVQPDKPIAAQVIAAGGAVA